MNEALKYIDVSGKHHIEDITWILQEKESAGSKLVYFSYDANLWPCPDYSTWNETEFKDRQKIRVLEFLKGFDGEVWLDDVKIKEIV